MIVYMLGRNGQSNTNGQSIITVKLLEGHTDMKGITMYHGKHIVNPFYRQLRLNAGYIERITDLEEEQDFSTSTVTHDCSIKVGQYFYIDSTNVSNHFIAYQYKVGVLEQTEYVSKNYNGVMYIHYPSGTIRTKSNYSNGLLHSRFYYRDDPFNTLERVMQFNKDVELECEFFYDNRESLLKQIWYDSRGKIYNQVNYNGLDLPEDHTEHQPTSPSEVTLSESSEPGSDIVSNPDDGPISGSGFDQGLKAKTGPASEN